MQTKQAKREKADAMNAEWAKLSPQKQIEELRKRPGNSARQIKRLEAKIEAAKG